ncbi:hypothetical protein BH23ACT6_BH23ACT6_06350 [soil metagenome]
MSGTSEVKTSNVWRYLAAGVGMTLLIVMSPFYFAAGLTAPWWAMLFLGIVWTVFLLRGVFTFREHPFQVLALPFLAAEGGASQASTHHQAGHLGRDGIGLADNLKAGVLEH